MFNRGFKRSQYIIYTYLTKSIRVSGVITLEASSPVFSEIALVTICAPSPGLMVVTKQIPKITAEMVVIK